MNGTTLTPVQLWALITLHKQLFVTIPVAPHTATPPLGNCMGQPVGAQLLTRTRPAVDPHPQ